MKKTLISLLLGSALTLSATVNAAVTLRFAHFWPANSAINQQIFEKWKEAVETESNGELKIQIFPSQTLTKVDQTYDGVVKGIADIGASAQGYTNGRFPLTQIAELPGMSNSSVQGGCLTQKLFEDGAIAKEYRNSHLLFMFATGPGILHSKDKAIAKPEDMHGMRIRRPTSVAGDLIESMGAAPVGMPSTDIYTSLQRGVMDGLTFPWEGMKTFHINELVHHHTDIPFYTVVFYMTMNQRVYDRLPDNLKKVIDDNSGMKWTVKAGKVFDAQDLEGKQQAISQGDAIITIKDPLNNPDWKGALDKGIQKYLQSVDKRGLDADGVYQKAREISAQCATIANES